VVFDGMLTVCVGGGQINHLFEMMLYVRQNEESSCLKIVHFHDGEEGVPSEMEANAKSELVFVSFRLFSCVLIFYSCVCSSR